MIVLSDFDGTIATQDMLGMLLEQCASPDWQSIERAWRHGEIDTRTCLASQLALLPRNEEALLSLLNEVTLDPGFERFYRWTVDNGVPIEIVSDGIASFIWRIMRRHGYIDIPIRANDVRPNETKPTGWTLLSPWWDPAFPRCATSKASVVKRAQAAGERVVFIGDGYSDREAVKVADTVFAKGELAVFCRERGIRHTPFETFDDIRRRLDAESGTSLEGCEQTGVV